MPAPSDAPQSGSPSAAPTGCCTIMQPDKPGQEYPHLTYGQCQAKANAIPGATFQWVPGECAE
jgi:hypothetical protein